MKWSIFAASAVIVGTASIANAEIFTCAGAPVGGGGEPSHTVTVVTPTDITPGGSFYFRRVTGIETELNTRRLMKPGTLEITRARSRTERHQFYQSTDIRREGNLVGMTMGPRGHMYTIRIDTLQEPMPFTLFHTGSKRDSVITGTCKK